jgi:hypothetical protein
MKRTLKKQHIFLIYLALAFITFIAFEQVRRNEFTNYDDHAYVTDNPYVKAGLTNQSVSWAFTKSHANNYHPLTWLSHMLDCQLFELDPSWHHLTNLWFHIANTLLLFWLLKRMTGSVWPSAFVAACFGLHPLHVESVAWIAERKDVLSAFFWMLTIITYIRYTERRSTRRYLLVVFVFALGLMAKPMLVTLPFVLLLLDYWPLDRLQLFHRKDEQAQPKSRPAAKQKVPISHLFTEKIPLFLLAAISSLVTFLVQQSSGATAYIESPPSILRISNAFVTYVTYIVKMFYPTPLAAFYPHPTYLAPAPPALTLLSLTCVLVVVAITAAAIYTIFRSRHRWFAAGWLWYIGTLIPVIGLVQVGGQAMADRYTYLPSIGIFIIIAWGAAKLANRWHLPNLGLAIISGVVLILLVICTRMQVPHWKNTFTIAEHSISVTKNNFAMHSILGIELNNQKRFKKALKHLDQTLRINPKHFTAFNTKGLALIGLGRTDEAIAVFNDILKIWPKAYQTYNNLGAAYGRQGKLDLAIQNFRKSLQLKPGYADAIKNLNYAQKKQNETKNSPTRNP